MLGVLLWFDVEDYVNEETDYALAELCRMLTDCGVSATFKFVGEKARVLMERNRSDIARGLTRHEVGFHTRLHSIHPTVSEYVEGLSLASGSMEFALREGAGLEQVIRFAGQGVTAYGQAGYSWAPHVFPVLRRWGIPVYLDVHDAVSFRSEPFWYGGILNAASLGETLRVEFVPGGVEAAMRAVDAMREASVDEKWRFVNCYYHPLEFVTVGFWDAVNFEGGRNPTYRQWKKVPVRPVVERDRMLEEFRRFIEYATSKEDVRFLTAGELYRIERSRQTPRDGGEMQRVAASLHEKISWVRLGDLVLAPAEIFQFFREFLAGRGSFGPLYGPEAGEGVSTATRVHVRDLVAALRWELSRVEGWEQLPRVFLVGNAQLNATDMLLTMAEAVRLQANEDEEVTVVRGELAAGVDVVSTAAWGRRWSIFPEDLEVPGIVALAQQQTWTARPAVF